MLLINWSFKMFTTMFMFMLSLIGCWAVLFFAFVIIDVIVDTIRYGKGK